MISWELLQTLAGGRHRGLGEECTTLEGSRVRIPAPSFLRSSDCYDATMAARKRRNGSTTKRNTAKQDDSSKGPERRRERRGKRR